MLFLLFAMIVNGLCQMSIARVDPFCNACKRQNAIGASPPDVFKQGSWDKSSIFRAFAAFQRLKDVDKIESCNRLFRQDFIAKCTFLHSWEKKGNMSLKPRKPTCKVLKPRPSSFAGNPPRWGPITSSGFPGHTFGMDWSIQALNTRST